MKKAAMKERVRCLSIVRQWLDDQFDASDKEECMAKALWDALAGSDAVHRDGTRNGTCAEDLEEKILLQDVEISRGRKCIAEQADEIAMVRSRDKLLIDDLDQAKAAIGALEEQVSKLEAELNDARGILLNAFSVSEERSLVKLNENLQGANKSLATALQGANKALATARRAQVNVENKNRQLLQAARGVLQHSGEIPTSRNGLSSAISELKAAVDTNPDRKLITLSRCECGSDSDHTGSLLCCSCVGVRGL